MEPIGHTISHYKILERLGAGGMGVVYKATDLRLDRLVALKFLPEHLSADQGVRTRFTVEAKAASALDHPNIATVHEIDEAPDGRLFIVMAYYPGEPLAARIDKGPMALADALEVAAQVGQGLVAAHGRGIVHRDIKPNNIIVTPGGLVKILDFGVAKVSNVHLTDPGLALGTPEFMSPEQTRGERVDHRCDVWALGVVLFNMIAGRVPFTGEDRHELLQAIRERPPAALRAPQDLHAIVIKALQKQPSDRYETMRAFVDDLRDAQPRIGRPWQTEANLPTVAANTDAVTVAVQPRARDPVLRTSGELRQLTMVSCELVDFEALGEALDPEQFREVLQAYRKACEDVVVAVDGRIEEQRDGEIRSQFGYPKAHEDDARRAVRAALEIVDRVRALNVSLGATIPALRRIRLQVRTGIHTGQVITEDEALSARQIVAGVTGSRATRTKEAAAPHQVLCTADTHRLVRGFFNVRSLGTTRLPGFSSQDELYEILGSTTAENRIEATENTGLTDLVGRSSELALLNKHWEEVTDGSGQIVLLSAEAGIGKSRLIHALKKAIPSELRTTLECRCSPYHQNSPLSPIVDLIRRVLAVPAQHSDPTACEALRAGLALRGLASGEDLYVFATLLGLPPPEDVPAPSWSPQRQNEATLARVLKLLVTFGIDRPALFVVEDLHWADPTTLDLLSLLIDQGPAARLLTILTFRPEFRSPWVHRTHLHHLSLGRLNRRESEAMMMCLTRGKPLPEAVMTQIVNSSDGVPLFVEELTKAILESDALYETDEEFRLTAALPSLVFPATLAESLTARLDRLGNAKQIAQLASVFGRTFSYEWIDAVCPLGERMLRAELSRLVEAELLFHGGAPPAYTFKHALIRDAAYQSLPAGARREYHGRIAVMLEECCPELAQAQPEVLGHHYTSAGLPGQAVEYWWRAGQSALRQSAHTEATAHLTLGLELIRSLPATPEWRLRELDFCIALGGARVSLMGYAAPAVGETFRRALELCDQVDESSQLFDTLQGLWAFHVVRAELNNGLALADRLVSLADRLDDRPRILEASLRRAISLYTTGNLTEARERMEGVLAGSDPSESQHSLLLFGQHRVVSCLSHSCWVHWLLGDPGRALAASEEALSQAGRVSHPFTQAFALLYSAMLQSLRREPSIVQGYAEALAAVSKEHAFAYRLAQSHILAGWAQAVSTQDADAPRRVEAAIERTRATGAEVLRPYYLLLLADASLACGQLSRGLGAVDEALAVIERSSERMLEAELHRLRGELLAASDPAGQDPATCFRRALEVARAQGATSLELRAASSLVRVAPDDRQARRHLERLLQAYGESLDAADVRRARELLPRIDAST